MRQYVNPVHLVTTTDGECPAGMIEIEVVRPWRRPILNPQKVIDQYSIAVEQARIDAELCGLGFLMLKPDATVERLAPEDVCVQTKKAPGVVS